MFNRKTDYARNKKDGSAIVYCDAEGRIIRLTRKDFSSLEVFLKWKAWSDASYHIIEKADHLYADKTCSLESLPEASAAVSSTEDVLSMQLDLQERTIIYGLVSKAMDACLTESQRRRFWLYYVDGLTETEIALAENVQQQNISKSIRVARKKLQTFFRKQGVKSPFSPR